MKVFFNERLCFCPAPGCTAGRKAVMCRSEKVIYVTSLIGNFQEKGPIRELYGKTCTDLHTPTDGKRKMRERDVEKRLVEDVKKRGGEAYKFTSPGRSGVPDRLILLPGGRMGFVELKSPGEKPRPLQEKVFSHLRKLGYRVEIVDSCERIGEALDGIQGA